MRNKFFFFLFLSMVCCTIVNAQSAFTAGDFVVLRVGNTSSGYTGGTGVYMDEYTTGGTLKQHFQLGSGGNFYLSNQADEGRLSLSGNGQYLSVAGYSGSGSTEYYTTATANARCVYMIKYDATNGITTPTVTSPVATLTGAAVVSGYATVGYTTNTAGTGTLGSGQYVYGNNIPLGVTVSSTTGAAVSGVTAGLTNTSTTVTCTNTNGLVPGMLVTGTGVPANAYVVSITPNTSFVLSSAATATNASASLSFSAYITLSANGTASGTGQTFYTMTSQTPNFSNGLAATAIVPKCAYTSDGTNFLLSSGETTLQYFNNGGTSGALTNLASGTTSTQARYYFSYNGQIYMSNSAGNNKMATLGSGTLPTTATTPTTLSYNTGSFSPSSPSQFYILSQSSNNVLYVAETATVAAASTTTATTGTVSSIVVASATGITAGQYVSGFNIPLGTQVSSSYSSGTTIPLTKTTTGSPAGNVVFSGATTTSSTTTSTSTITVALGTNIAVGEFVTGQGTNAGNIPANTIVTAVSGTSITLSNSTTGTLASTTLTFNNYGILKYTYVGSKWTGYQGYDVSGANYQGLIAQVSGSNVVLYATRKVAPATTTGSELVTITDAGTATGSFSGSETVLANTATTADGSWRSLAFVPQAPPSTTFYYDGANPLNSLSSWWSIANGSGIGASGSQPTSFATTGQTFIIGGTTSVTTTNTNLAANLAIGAGSYLQVGDGTNTASLTLSSGTTYSISGTINVSATGTLINQSTTTPTLGTLSSGSTVTFAGSGTQSVPAAGYSNLSVTNSTGPVTAGGTISVGINLNISGATLDMTTSQLTGAFTTSGTGTLNTAYVNGTNSAIPSGNTYSFAVNYDAASGGQYFGGTFNGGITFSNTSGTNTATTSVTVSGTMAITNANSIVNMVNHTLAGTSITTSGSGTLETQVLNSSGAIAAGQTWNFTVEFNGASTQTLPQGGTPGYSTFTNLIITSNTTATLYSSIKVTGVLTINSGSILNTGNNNTITGSFTTSGTGILATSCPTATSATPLSTNITYSFEVDYTSSSAQTIVAGNYTTLNSSNFTTTTTSTGTTNPIVVGSATGIAVGETVTGTNIPANTTVTNVAGTNITLSNAPTATIVGTITFGGGTGAARTLASGTVAISTSFIPGTTSAYTVNSGNVISLGYTNTLPTLGSSSASYAGLTITAGTTTAPSTLTIGGNFTLSSGATFVAPSGNFTVGGNWNNAGTYTSNGGSVILNGTGQSLTGTTTFNNFTKSVTSADVITFPAGLTQTFNGTLTLSGASSNLLTIASSSASAANIDPQGSTSVYDVSVSYSDNTSGTNIVANNSTDGGNNTGWTFMTASTWTGASSTNWNDASNWSPSGVPSSSAVVTITKTGSYDLAIEVSPSVASMTISSGNNVTLNNGQTLTLTGTLSNSGSFTANSTSTVVVAGACTVSGAGTTNFNNLTINNGESLTGGVFGISGTFTNNGTYAASGGTVTFNGTAAQTIPAGTYANLSVTNTSATVTAGGAIVIGSSINIASNATLDMSTYQLTGTTFTQTSPSGDITSGSTSITVSSATSIIAGQQVYGTDIAPGTLVASSYTSGTSIPLTIAATGNSTASITLTFGFATSGTGTLKTQNITSPAIPASRAWSFGVVYNNASGSQTVPSSNFENGLTISNTSGTNAANSTVTVSGGTLTLTNAGSSLNMGAHNLAGPSSGTLTTAGNAAAILSTQVTGSSTALPAGVNWAFTVEFNGGGAQTFPQGTSTFQNLTVTSSSTATLYNSITINGVLTINSGSTLNTNAGNTISGSFTTSGTGILTTAVSSATSTTPLPAGITYSFEVDYTSVSTQTIVAGNYINLNGTGNNRTLSSTGTISIAGVFTVGSGTYTTTGSTVAFAGTSGVQTVPAISFNNLSITNTSGTVSAGGAISVAGNLNIAPSATFDMGTYQLTGSTLTTTGTGILKTQCIASPAIPAGSSGLSWSFNITYYNATGSQVIPLGTFNDGLTISNTSGTNSSSSITVAGALTLTNAGSTLNMGTNILTAGSSFSTSGSGLLTTQYQYSGAIPAGQTWAFTVEYNSAVATQVLPNGTGTFTNLVIDNTFGTVGLYGNISVTGTLTLTSGILSLGSDNLTLANAPSGYSNSSYINASSTGLLTIQNVPSSGNTVFPIGTATSYAPLTFTGGTAGANISVGVKSTFTHAVPSPNNVVNLQWSILASSATQPTVKFQYNGTDAGSGYSSTNAVLGTYASSAYTESTLGSVNGSNPYTASIAFTTNLPTTTASLYGIGDKWAFLATVPGAPTSVSATDGDGLATVSFTAPSNTGGTGIVITGYTVTSTPGSITASGASSPITVTGLTDGTSYTFTVTATNEVGTSAASAASNSVTPSSTTTWNGTAWSAGAPINSDAQSVVISGNLTDNSSTFTHCNNLTIYSGVTFTTTNTINVTGLTFVNDGTISSGTIILSGATSQTVSGNGLVGSLTVNNSNGVTVSNALNHLSISGVLTLQAGTLTTNGNVTLKSLSISNSGIIAPIGASGNTGTISGNVTVERYIPAGYRAYRDMAPQVYNAGSMFLNWQENGSFTNNGYGMFITGAGATDASETHYSTPAFNSTNGLDYSMNGVNSAYTYNGTFNAITNTKTTTLDPFAGYRVLIRGDRSFNLESTPIVNYPAGLRMVDATALRATGQLVTGTVTYGTSGVTNAVTGTDNSVTLSNTTNGFSMIANPYVCPVNWGSPSDYGNDGTNVYGSSTNINGSFWFLDPTYGSTGSYDSYNAMTGSNFQGDGSHSNQYIEPGQAIFVQTSAAGPSVVFNETAKAATSTKLTVFGASNPLSKVYVSLWKGSSTGYDRVDGAAAAFHEGFTNATYGPQDALKFGGASDILYIADKGKTLSIDGRLPATAGDAIALKIVSPSTTSYQLKVDATNYINEGYSPLLYDAYKNTTTALGSGVTTVDFTVDATKTASYADRFTILFSPSALAVNSIVASATLNDKVATITWSTVGEKGESYYEVEKSTDGKNFASIGQQAAKNTASASYTAIDNNVASGNNYYRIKAVSETGAVNYSNVAKVQLSVNGNQFTVYPNPLVGKTLNVQVANLAAGKYVVSIYNALGQKVNEQTISHAGGSASHALLINSTLAGGIYSVVIREEGISNQIVHQTSLSVQP